MIKCESGFRMTKPNQSLCSFLFQTPSTSLWKLLHTTQWSNPYQHLNSTTQNPNITQTQTVIDVEQKQQIPILKHTCTLWSVQNEGSWFSSKCWTSVDISVPFRNPFPKLTLLFPPPSETLEEETLAGVLGSECSLATRTEAAFPNLSEEERRCRIGSGSWYWDGSGMEFKGVRGGGKLIGVWDSNSFSFASIWEFLRFIFWVVVVEVDDGVVVSFNILLLMRIELWFWFIITLLLIIIIRASWCC